MIPHSWLAGDLGRRMTIIAAKPHPVVSRRFGACRTVAACGRRRPSSRVGHGCRSKYGRGCGARRGYRARHYSGRSDGRAGLDRQRAGNSRANFPPNREHLLRPFGWPAWRRDCGRTRRQWTHHSHRGGRRGDGCRVEILDCVRRRFDVKVSNQTNLLSTLPGLERAPISCCRSCGRGDLATVPGAGLADPRVRHARGADHLGGTNRPVRDIRVGPRPGRSRASNPSGRSNDCISRDSTGR